MKTLRAYVLAEHAGPFFATLGALTVVLLIGNIVKFAELIIAKGVNPLDIIRLLLYLIPFALSFTIPMAVLVAMVLAFGRLSGDYELIAMKASGIAPARLLAPILTAGLLLCGIVLVLHDRVVPSSHLAFRRQLKTIGIKKPAALLEAGMFIKEFDPYTIFIYQIEGRHLFHVRIYEPTPGGPTRTIIADRGMFEPLPRNRGVELTLEQGTIDEWDPEHPGSLYKVAFQTYRMRLLADAEASRRVQKKLKELTFGELRRERAKQIAQDIDPLPIDIEFHRKIASSFATLVFALFGLWLGLGQHHHERLISFVWVLGLFLTYYLLSAGVSAVALKDWIAPWLALWLPNLLGGVIGGALVWRTVRR